MFEDTDDLLEALCPYEAMRAALDARVEGDRTPTPAVEFDGTMDYERGWHAQARAWRAER